MKLWIVHPKYLDKHGLIALWRDGLLAQSILQGKAQKYKISTQLDMFKQHRNPLQAIGAYLCFVASEACRRGYKFAHEKIAKPNFDYDFIGCSDDAAVLDFSALKNKLKNRDLKHFHKISHTKKIALNPVFGLELVNRGSFYK